LVLTKKFFGSFFPKKNNGHVAQLRFLKKSAQKFFVSKRCRVLGLEKPILRSRTKLANTFLCDFFLKSRRVAVEHPLGASFFEKKLGKKLCQKSLRNVEGWGFKCSFLPKKNQKSGSLKKN